MFKLLTAGILEQWNINELRSLLIRFVLIGQ